MMTLKVGAVYKNRHSGVEFLVALELDDGDTARTIRLVNVDNCVILQQHVGETAANGMLTVADLKDEDFEFVADSLRIWASDHGASPKATKKKPQKKGKKK